ncbi:hypothetical protein A2483_04740 [Candidatus Peregrinibacteria bacterium RIFOXYC2_FULL_33_13]|nr:MAG: hypothetical protein UR27_C0030G0003 [Candidatus Peregrinibacteria bacterium GW2011_GWA2_33_10]KKP41136.1 MAG: glycosyl transferase family protein [Candidatus Peregrinibacteria bacterium GW2011_GWC2_33_13]OGJ48850.1 MAG: hypothetical protein A2229_05080 [Candidatus Peregrinibacteria bacterium RIFOXYA2_FULL_33_7]OGJ54499.1 MAG: hypothetical protein A2483_04740 [Candidatus Peregrinibacteria bacterium RIFOXYC2_FULL_33_13]
MAKVTIIVINFNGEKYLKNCLKSLSEQTYKHKEIFFIDNNSNDDSIKFVRENFPHIMIFGNKENRGYAAAANQGIKASSARYIMIINPDVILNKDYLEKAVKKMEIDHRIAAISGKIFYYDFLKNKKTEIIDSVGLHCFRNRRVIDKGQGEKDKVRYDVSKEVFGVSGACPLYRIYSLKDIALNDEIFDEDFFMYKEDVDLSWRLKLRGWKSYYLADSIAYHSRGTGALDGFDHLSILKNRKHLSKFQKYHAYKNQRLMQIKNEMLSNFFQDFFPIMSKEILILGYMLFKEPRLLKALTEIISKLPKMLKKRKIIMKNKKLNSQEIKVWLQGIK